MTTMERRVFLKLVEEKYEEEKKALDEAKSGRSGQNKSGGDSIMRQPMPGEGYGSTDLEKLGPPSRVARFVRGQDLMRQRQSGDNKE